MNLSRGRRPSELCLAPSRGASRYFRTKPALTAEQVNPCCRIIALARHMIDMLAGDADISLYVATGDSRPSFLGDASGLRNERRKLGRCRNRRTRGSWRFNGGRRWSGNVWCSVYFHKAAIFGPSHTECFAPWRNSDVPVRPSYTARPLPLPKGLQGAHTFLFPFRKTRRKQQMTVGA
jgi:hypothetical protein